jgi:peroxiredoxin
MNRNLIFALVCGVFLIPYTHAAAELGMPAPGLQVKEWVNGAPSPIFQNPQTNIYVMLFWETGCPHCLAALPELTALQAKFGRQGLIVLGISPEPADALKEFIKGKEYKIGFPLGADNQRKTYQSYMTAFQQAAVPYTFVVGKQGTIVWQRHPMAGLGKAVEQLVSGTFDFEAEKRASIAEKIAQDYIRVLKKEPGGPQNDSLTDQIVTNGVANPWMLNNFACDILDVPGVQGKPLELAIQTAKIAYDAAGGTDSAFADTYAHALFAGGRLDEAVTMQKRAIELCTDKRLLPYLQKILENYQTNRPAISK